MMEGGEDNKEVIEESGCARLCKSTLMALILAPILVISMVCVLGWNEKRSVCEQRSITQGKDMVEETLCSGADVKLDDLVMFSCGVATENLTIASIAYPAARVGVFTGAFNSYVGTGIKTVAMMKQCKETVTSTTKKDSTGGGTTTVKNYTYSLEYSETLLGNDFAKPTSTEFISGCGSGAQNPTTWPTDAPKSGEAYARGLMVGSYVLDSTFIKTFPLDTPISLDYAPQGWTTDGNTYYSDMNGNSIGDLKYEFYGNSVATEPVYTVLGRARGCNENPNAELDANGECRGIYMTGWESRSYWPCDGYGLRSLVKGEVSKVDLFGMLASADQTVTMIVRFIGWILLWFAFYLCAGPLEVAADCIPCIGPCLGDALIGIACCVSCLPATALAGLVIGFCWMIMRPWVGVPMLIVAGFVWFMLFLFKLHSKCTQVKPVPDAAPKELSLPPGITEDVARVFIQAMRDEYAHSEDQAVGNYLQTLPEDQQKTLVDVEKSVHDESKDAVAHIDEIELSWGLR